MAKKKQRSKKKTTKAVGSVPTSASKVSKAAPVPSYRHFRLDKRIKRSSELSPSFKLFGKSLDLLVNHRRIFSGITLIYGLLTIIFVREFSGGLNVSRLKNDVSNLIGTSSNGWSVGIDIFRYMLSNNNTGKSDVAGLYQVLLFVIVSLAVIWTLRQIQAGTKAKLKDAYYKSTSQFIPFIVVLFVFAFQMLPLVLGSALYKLVSKDGLAVTVPEQIIWVIVFFLLSLLSVYLICSSIFALYIVTLPDMTPMKALRSARQLVLHRRWNVIRKVVFLPFVLVVIAGIIMIPIIMVAAPIAEWTFFALTMLSVPVIHSYYYALYRELL